MLSTGIVHNPFSCGGEEEIALSVGIDISNNIVIVFAEGIVDFAPVIVMIGTVFIGDWVIVSGCQPQLYNMDVLINRKLNQHFLICAVYNLESSIGRWQQKCIVRSEQVAELCIRCYEDNVAGKLSDEMFMRFSQKYETERLELKEKISAYRKRLSDVDEMQLGKEKFIAAVRKFMQMDKLTAPLLQELIDRIDVYEVTGTGKNRKQMIKIHYKFVGYLELPSLARRHNYREETRKGVAVEYVPNALPA